MRDSLPTALSGIMRRVSAAPVGQFAGQLAPRGALAVFLRSAARPLLGCLAAAAQRFRKRRSIVRPDREGPQLQRIAVVYAVVRSRRIAQRNELSRRDSLRERKRRAALFPLDLEYAHWMVIGRKFEPVKLRLARLDRLAELHGQLAPVHHSLHRLRPQPRGVKRR